MREILAQIEGWVMTTLRWTGYIIRAAAMVLAMKAAKDCLDLAWRLEPGEWWDARLRARAARLLPRR